MTRCSPTCQLLQHLRRVQQVHVLADACCALELIDLQPCLAGTSAVSCITELYVLTDKAAEATRLILDAGRQTSGHSSRNNLIWECNPVLQSLKQAVYGTVSPLPRLSELLYSASVEQSKSVKRGCVAILSQSLTASGADFVILEAAVQAGVPPLCTNALDQICSKFSHAVTADLKGWADLSQEAVMLVLCSSKLQVNSEKDVLAALASWIEAQPEQRTCLFEAMFVHYALVDITAAAEQCAMLPDGLIAWASALACMPEILQLSLYIAACAVQAVRLDQLTYTALQEIDSHPLVAAHQKAYMQVAHALLAWHTGTRSPTSLASHGSRQGQRVLQMLADECQKVTVHQHLDSMQLVTDRHSMASAADESSQIHQPASSSLQSSDDLGCQQNWGVSGDMSQPDHMDLHSQHDHASQRSQQSDMYCTSSMLHHAHGNQQGHNGPDARQRLSSQRLDQGSGGEDQVQLSCSVNEGQSRQLKGQGSAISQLMDATAGWGSSHVPVNALLHQGAECPRVSVAPQKVTSQGSQTLSKSRTEETLMMPVCTQGATVSEEMAVSPSAVHGRRKQARLDSARCLKF